MYVVLNLYEIRIIIHCRNKKKTKIDIEKEKRQFITFVFSFKAVNNVDSGNVHICYSLYFNYVQSTD